MDCEYCGVPMEYDELTHTWECPYCGYTVEEDFFEEDEDFDE